MSVFALPYTLLRRDGEAPLSRAEPPRELAGIAPAGATATSPERRGGLMRPEVGRLIGERRFQLAFQPVVRLADMRPVSHLALPRLADTPDAQPGAPTPSARGFVEIARGGGFGPALDGAVLDVALATWTRGTETPISVNIAARSLRDPVFFARLLRRVAGEGRRIGVELGGVEGPDDLPPVAAAVAALRAARVPVTLDDFAASEVMLACVQAARFDAVKFAGAVLGAAVAGSRGRRLLAELVKLAALTGAKTVANWVESEPEAALPRGLGVGHGQGWLFGAPEVPAASDRRHPLAPG